MKTISIAFLCLAICMITTTKAEAQQLKPIVIAASGGLHQSATGSLSFTVGEMSAVSTLTTPSAILTQGFQQVWEVITGLFDPAIVRFTSIVYPNPSDGHFHLETNFEWNGIVEISIRDLLGKEVERFKVDLNKDVQKQAIDLSGVPQGMYMLTIVSYGDRDSPRYFSVAQIEIIK
jgi:hypothetical protein